MPKWLKVTLILFGIGLLMLGLMVGGVAWWIHSNKDMLVKEGGAARKEGKAYGATHAQRECVDDGLARSESCGRLGIMCQAMNNIRLKSCMSVAREDGSCDGVPKRAEIVQAALWGSDECKRRGLPASQQCRQFVNGLVEACDPANAK